MGYYIRKRVRILPGVWVNLGKNGLSLSGGIGAFRYYQPLNSRGKKATKPKETLPEPITEDYVGFSIMTIGLLIFIIGLFCGWGVIGLFIFGGCLFVGSIALISSKYSKRNNYKIIIVNDEKSLREAVDNLNMFLDLMGKDTDSVSLSNHYNLVRKQFAQLPPSLILNNMDLEQAKTLAMSEYAKNLKKISSRTRV